MAEQAHVTSVEAIDSFRTSLVLYVSKARPALEEVSAEVVRIRMWLENEQRMHWENQVRRRSRELEDAQQTLSSARMALMRRDTTAEQMAVVRAKHAREDAEAKLKVVKQWNREFDSRVEPLAKQMDKLQTVLTTDMAQAIAYLAQVVSTLAAYADVAPSSAMPPPVAPRGENKTEDIVAGEVASPNASGGDIV